MPLVSRSLTVSPAPNYSVEFAANGLLLPSHVSWTVIPQLAEHLHVVLLSSPRACAAE